MLAWMELEKKYIKKSRRHRCRQISRTRPSRRKLENEAQISVFSHGSKGKLNGFLIYKRSNEKTTGFDLICMKKARMKCKGTALFKLDPVGPWADTTAMSKLSQTPPAPPVTATLILGEMYVQGGRAGDRLRGIKGVGEKFRASHSFCIS